MRAFRFSNMHVEASEGSAGTGQVGTGQQGKEAVKTPVGWAQPGWAAGI